MEKKMTYVTAIDKALMGEMTPDVISRLNDLRTSLSKPNVSKAQQDKADARCQRMNQVLATLESEGEWMNIPALLAKIPALAGVSPQSVSNMLTELRKAGKVDRKVEKGKVYFRVMTSEGEAE